jgi:hypothetical protein
MLAACSAEAPAPPGTPTSSPPSAAAEDASGQITLDELTAGPVPVPQWIVEDPDGVWGELPGWLQDACPAGPTSLTTSFEPSSGRNTVVAGVAYANLDDDPAQETAALLSCYGASQAVPAQVVAYERDAAGQIVALARSCSATSGAWRPTRPVESTSTSVMCRRAAER